MLHRRKITKSVLKFSKLVPRFTPIEHEIMQKVHKLLRKDINFPVVSEKNTAPGKRFATADRDGRNKFHV